MKTISTQLIHKVTKTHSLAIATRGGDRRQFYVLVPHAVVGHRIWMENFMRRDFLYLGRAVDTCTQKLVSHAKLTAYEAMTAMQNCISLTLQHGVMDFNHETQSWQDIAA